MKGSEQIAADEAALARRKRERCRHENADHLFPGQGWALMSGAEMPDALVEQLRCNDCGAWLPLGPSADDSDAVRVEIAAARLSVEPRGGEMPGHDEHWGRGLQCLDCGDDSPPMRVQSYCPADALAWEIAHHEEPSE